MDRRGSTRLSQSWILIAMSLVLGPGSAMAVEIRWALSSDRIYVTGPGVATLSDIKAAQDQVPLEQVANGVWHLRANLIVEKGAQLVLHGTAIGGDVNQLRLQSNNSADTNRFVFVNADWGSISIRNTSISSWDDTVGGPDTEYGAYGRAFIGVRSKLGADGVTPLESRMDIVDSDIGYLGYDASEAYGLAWKVIGDSPGLFELVDVFGDIVNSRIHHNYFGVYTFGAYGMRWLNNEVAYNVQYGFDPHDDSDHLLIQGNNAHHNGNHGIIASKRCDHLTIRGNVCWANVQNGIILHRSSDDCVLEDNRCHENGDTGIVLAGSSRSIVRRNVMTRNFEAGIRLNLGSADNLIEANESASNQWYGVYFFKGSDDPEPGDDDGRPKGNRFVNNLIHDNGKEAINLADSDDNTFSGNTFYANSDKLRFERGFRNRLDGNAIPADVIVKTVGSLADASSTFVRNQSTLRVGVDEYSSTIFEAGDGQIFDAEEKRVVTTVTPLGSALKLTHAEIGTTTTVLARNFWVEATNGTVLVNPVYWPSTGSLTEPRLTMANTGLESASLSGASCADTTKRWVTKADFPGQSVRYTIGDLRPNTVYTVLKEDFPLLTLLSSPAGRITFADAVRASNEVLYTIEDRTAAACQHVRVEKLVDELVISWTSGTLQRAATLSPANWLDVSVTNGQFRVAVKTTEPMEFFRVFEP